MTEFLFCLTPVAGDAETSMIYDALQERFPSHRFSPVQTDDPDLENSIVPRIKRSAGASGAVRFNFDLVNEVELMFQELISATRGWKPS